MNSMLQQLMLPQLAIGGVETAFNKMLTASPHLAPHLRKLAGKILEIQLKTPDLHFFILFSETRTDWLSSYEGEADCTVKMKTSALPQLSDKSKLTELINDKTLILHGDIHLLQHFTALMEQVEKDPAEWLSHLIGDVPAQLSTDLAKHLFGKLHRQFTRSRAHIVDNLTTERPILTHRLQVADFCDQVKILEQQAVRLEQKFTHTMQKIESVNKPQHR